MDSFSWLVSDMWKYIVIGAILFLFFREVITWYWKLNRIVSLLERIEKNTRPVSVSTALEKNEVPLTGKPTSLSEWWTGKKDK